MTTRRFLLIALLLSTAIASCRKGQPVANSNEPQQLPDKSTLEVNTASDGTKTEARVFEGGELVRATRITKPKTEPKVLVELRDGRTAMLKNPDEVAGVLEASEEDIASAAKRVIGAGAAPQPPGGVTTGKPAPGKADAKKPGAPPK